MKCENIFESLNFNSLDETFTTLVENEYIKIEKIVTSGQISEKDFWYDQEWDEFVLVLEGSAVITFETKEVTLVRGDSIYINAHEKHQISWSDPKHVTLWLAVFVKN